MERYKTVAAGAEAEITEKKSRFIAHVSPVCSEEEAASFIAAVKKKHYNATHNVFAYALGRKLENVKASDDGEPSGTAGVPILDILKKEGVTDCVVVVTRYFGGTLLGTGGLVRAYSKAAKEGLLAAGVVEMALCALYEIDVDYHTYGKLRFELEKNEFKIDNAEFTENVSVNVVVDIERSGELFLALVKDCCAGRETVKELERAYREQ